MLDIIIPTYKNPEGLRRTLRSIDYITSEITVTVVSDGDHMETNYTPIFEEFPFANLWIQDKNCGPGNAREIGMTATSEPYITFIDTDDYFFPQMLEKVVAELKSNPDFYEYRWHYMNKNKIQSAMKNNHMLSIVYKRSFLEEYDAHFCCDPFGSYANEDIGFNRYLRIILRDLEIKQQKKYIKFYNEALACWTEDDQNSLTRKDNHIFSYTKNSEGLAVNEIAAIKRAEKYNVNKRLILTETGTIMAALYTIFIKTLYARPEYANVAWNGAKLFYNNIYARYEQEALYYARQRFSTKIKELREHTQEKPLNIPINIVRFINDLKTYVEIPKHYI